MTTTDDERTASEWVWCACWERCKGIGVPGWDGGGRPMLCEACEADDVRERAERERAA